MDTGESPATSKKSTICSPKTKEDISYGVVEILKVCGWLVRQPVPGLVLWYLSQRSMAVIDSVLTTED